jgi:hypothetical protein
MRLTFLFEYRIFRYFVGRVKFHIVGIERDGRLIYRAFPDYVAHREPHNVFLCEICKFFEDKREIIGETPDGYPILSDATVCLPRKD